MNPCDDIIADYHYYHHQNLFVYQSAFYSHITITITITIKWSFQCWNFYLTISKAAALVQLRGWHGQILLVEGLLSSPTGSKVEGGTLAPDKQKKRKLDHWLSLSSEFPSVVLWTMPRIYIRPAKTTWTQQQHQCFGTLLVPHFSVTPHPCDTCVYMLKSYW